MRAETRTLTAAQAVKGHSLIEATDFSRWTAAQAVEGLREPNPGAIQAWIAAQAV